MGSVGAAISRNRQQSRTQTSYSPDLEYVGQGYADALYGPGSPYGGVGMSGGQYVSPQATQGFGTTRFGDVGTQYLNPNTAAGNIYPGGAKYGYGQGAYGQPGTAGGYGSPADGGSYQWGPGGGGYGAGGYSAMSPYQFGSGGAMGDLAATGAAAYGGYGQTYGGYGRLGQQYARMGSQGVTPTERANLMAASNEAIQSNLRSQRDQIANRAAQSGNTAGMLSAQAQLGASAGQQLESADRANQIAVLQENQRRREAGLAGQAGALGGQLGAAGGQAGLYGTGAGYASNLLAGRGRLASLQRQGYTQGAGTGATVQGQYGFSGS